MNTAKRQLVKLGTLVYHLIGIMAVLIGRVAVIHVLRLHGYSISNACRLTDDLQINRSGYRFEQTIGFRDARFELMKGLIVVLGSSVCTMVVG